MTENTGRDRSNAWIENSIAYKNERLNERTDRNYLFDNIKAVLIFSVVIAHYFKASASFDISTIGGVIYAVAFSYIMQVFMFISGHFSRNLDKCRSGAFQTFLFPYFVLMPIMFAIRYFLFGKAHFDLTLPTMALWFLLTMFAYRFFLKDLIKIKNILPVSIFISLAAGYIPFLDSTLSLGRTFSFLPFFLAGYYFKAEWIEKLRRIPKAASCILLALLLAFAAYSALYRPFPPEAFYMKASYESTGLENEQGLVLRVVLSLVSLAWIIVFISLLPKSRSFLSHIGQNTMTVYILHIVIRYLVKSFGGFFGQNLPSYLVLTLTAVLTVWIFSRPVIVQRYNHFFDTLYHWVITYPQALIRQIL